MAVFWSWLGENTPQFQALGGLFQLIAIGILIYTLFLGIKQLRISVSQTQGNTISQIAETGRNLFLKAMDDKDLEILLNPSAANSNPGKVDHFVGVQIQHYALAFRQWKLNNIPEYFWKEIVRDARQFFRIEQVKKRRNHIVGNYEPDFASFVDEMIDC